MLSHSGKVLSLDQTFDADESDTAYANYVFVRLVAKRRRFTQIDFKYSFFDTCYLRDCIFDACDFTGCRFTGTNLHGSRFSGCKFDYAVFERTIIENDVLDTECPGPDNLKMRFARTLRVNYQQLGDAKSANKAIGVELAATESHLSKAWGSKESYYRKKYAGWRRFRAFTEWLEFRILDLAWGNGENALKLLRTAVVILLVIGISDAFLFRDRSRVQSYVAAFLEAPQVFLGTYTPSSYPRPWLTCILFVRLIMFGFFMSIIIKRFNRR